MSSTATLTASATAAQAVPALASIAINGGTPEPVSVNWTIEDVSVAVIESVLEDGSAIVRAVADPAGNSTRTASVTATVVDGPFAGQKGTGTVTVVTNNDTAVVTVDFGTPMP